MVGSTWRLFIGQIWTTEIASRPCTNVVNTRNRDLFSLYDHIAPANLQLVLDFISSLKIKSNNSKQLISWPLHLIFCGCQIPFSTYISQVGLYLIVKLNFLLSLLKIIIARKMYVLFVCGIKYLR